MRGHEGDGGRGSDGIKDAGDGAFGAAVDAFWRAGIHGAGALGTLEDFLVAFAVGGAVLGVEESDAGGEILFGGAGFFFEEFPEGVAHEGEAFETVGEFAGFALGGGGFGACAGGLALGVARSAAGGAIDTHGGPFKRRRITGIV